MLEDLRAICPSSSLSISSAPTSSVRVTRVWQNGIRSQDTILASVKAPPAIQSEWSEVSILCAQAAVEPNAGKRGIRSLAAGMGEKGEIQMRCAFYNQIPAHQGMIEG